MEDVSNFLASVAEPTPAPGGGTSAGVAAALAAALVEMSAGIASTADAVERAAALRAQALQLAEDELSSYAPVLEARTPAERTTALAAASEPPAQIAEVAAEVAELGAEVASSAADAVRGDAVTGVVLAEAASAAAARLVRINLGSGEPVDRADRAAERAATTRSRVT